MDHSKELERKCEEIDKDCQNDIELVEKTRVALIAEALGEALKNVTQESIDKLVEEIKDDTTSVKDLTIGYIGNLLIEDIRVFLETRPMEVDSENTVNKPTDEVMEMEIDDTPLSESDAEDESDYEP